MKLGVQCVTEAAEYVVLSGDGGTVRQPRVEEVKIMSTVQSIYRKSYYRTQVAQCLGLVLKRFFSRIGNWSWLEAVLRLLEIERS